MWSVAFERDCRAVMWAAVNLREPGQLLKGRRECETHLSVCSRGTRVISCCSSCRIENFAPRLFIMSSVGKLSHCQKLCSPANPSGAFSFTDYLNIQNASGKSNWTLGRAGWLLPGCSSLYQGLPAAVDQTWAVFRSNFSHLWSLLQICSGSVLSDGCLMCMRVKLMSFFIWTGSFGKKYCSGRDGWSMMMIPLKCCSKQIDWGRGTNWTPEVPAGRWTQKSKPPCLELD